MGPWAASRLTSSQRNASWEVGHFLLSLEARAPVRDDCGLGLSLSQESQQGMGQAGMEFGGSRLWLYLKSGVDSWVKVGRATLKPEFP